MAKNSDVEGFLPHRVSDKSEIRIKTPVLTCCSCPLQDRTEEKDKAERRGRQASEERDRRVAKAVDRHISQARRVREES